MRSLLLLRCHAYPTVCVDRVLLLRALNPGIPVCGLYGGVPESAGEMRATMGGHVEDWYHSRMPAEWNWRHGDLAVRRWYRDVGECLEFDRVYVVEWDLLLLAPVEVLYRHVPVNAVAVTARFPLWSVAGDWGWTTQEPYKSEVQALLSWAKREHGYDGSPFASLGPGTCLSRQFLEHYAAIDVPELAADEVRVPLLAQCFRLPVVDTRFRTSWRDLDELRFFNCQGCEVLDGAIHAEMADANGRRAFHPVRRRVDVGGLAASALAAVEKT